MGQRTHWNSQVALPQKPQAKRAPWLPWSSRPSTAAPKARARFEVEVSGFPLEHLGETAEGSVFFVLFFDVIACLLVLE